MFIHICKGLWYGTIGILFSVLSFVGLGWLLRAYWEGLGFEQARAYSGNSAKEKRNIFHWLGDVWNVFFK